MQPDNTGQNERERKCPPDEGPDNPPEIAVVSAAEALRQDLRDVEVPAGQSVMLSPYEREYADCFARVAVRNYDDLQTLGLVPRGLSEDRVRRAIADDDEETYKAAREMLASQPAPHGGCECKPEAAGSANVGTLRQHYSRARRSFNPALSRLLSDHLKTRVEWDSPVAGVVRRWASYAADAGLYADTNFIVSVQILRLRDIIIGPGATLHVDPGTQDLLAATIWIHQTGRLRHGGGYLKIWASAISRYRDLHIQIEATPAASIPWLAKNA